MPSGEYSGQGVRLPRSGGLSPERGRFRIPDKQWMLAHPLMTLLGLMMVAHRILLHKWTSYLATRQAKADKASAARLKEKIKIFDKKF